MSYTILYVDPDAERTAELRGPLEAEGHRLVTVQGAVGAIASLQEDRPDIVVLDAGLPDGSVSELCQALREAEGGAQVALVVVSAGDDTEGETVAELAQSGADLVVEKPITAERLFGLCKDLLSSDAATAGADDRADDGPEAVRDGDDEKTEPLSFQTGDELLDPESVQSAMGRLESIVTGSEDGDDDDPGARERAAARGDFSELLEEVNVDHPPTHLAGNRSEPDAESNAEPESAAQGVIEVVEETGLEPLELSPEAVAGDEGQDIEDHLDTLFSAGRKSGSPAVAPSPAPMATVETPEEATAPAPAPAPFDDPFDAPEDAPLEAENVAPLPEISPFPEPAVPTPIRQRDDTGPIAAPPVMPAARELFDPPDSPPAPARARERGGRTWLYAALAAFVVVGVVAAWFLAGLAGEDPATDRTSTASTTLPAPTIDSGSSTPVPPETRTPGSAVPPPRPAETTKPVATTTATPPREATSESSRATRGAAGTTKSGETRTSAPVTTTGRTATKPAAPAPTTTRTAEATPRPPVTNAKTPKATSPPPPASTKTAEAATRPPVANTKTAETTAQPPVANTRTAETTTQPPATNTEIAETTTQQPVTNTTTAETTAEPPATNTRTVETTTQPPVTTTGAADAAAVADGSTRPGGTTPKPVETTTASGSDATPPGSAASPAVTEQARRSATNQEPIQPVADVRVPVVLNRVEPEFSAKSLKKGGTIVLKVLVNEQGGISRVLVERGIPGSDAEAAAINAVLRWKFQPATRQGKATRAWTKVSFEFGR